MRPPVTLLAAFSAWFAAVCGAAEYAFTLNGLPERATICSLNGTPDDPQPGDVARVRGWNFTLDAPGHYFLETDQRTGDRLWRKSEKGRQLLAVEMYADLHPDKPVFKVMPSQLSASERKGLRGVRIEAWHRRFPKELAMLNLERVCITHDFDGDATLYKGAEFPRNVTRLITNVVNGQPPRGARFPKLVLLGAENINDKRGIEWISTAGKLRYLAIGGFTESPIAPDALALLQDLRFLEIRYGDFEKAIPSIGDLPRLKEVNLQSCKVGNGLSAWHAPELEVLTLFDYDTAVLPAANLPKLRRAQFSPHTLPAADLARFQAGNPAALVEADWRSPFVRAVTGTDRIRARNGGACCKPGADELNAYDTRDAAEIAELIESFRPIEEKGGAAILDCGGRALEFFKGDSLVATVGFRGGLLTWDGWPMQGCLTQESGRQILHWFDRRGIFDMHPIHAALVGDGAALRQRFLRYQQILPAPVCPDMLASAGEMRMILKLWPGAFDDPKILARRALEVYGCHEDSWNVSAGFDAPLREQILPQLSLPVILEIGLSAETSDAERNGIARWLLADGAHSRMNDDSFDRLLTACFREALVHPRVINRRYAMHALSLRNTASARSMMMEIITGRLAPPATPRETHGDAAGILLAFPERPNLPDDLPDAVAAAAHLLRNGGVAAHGTIQAALPSLSMKIREMISPLLRQAHSP